MIEAGANEVPEDTMIEAIYKAHDVNQEIIRIHRQDRCRSAAKQKHAYASCAVPEELFEAIKEIVPPEEMEEAVFTDDKQTREENIREITDKTCRMHLQTMKNGLQFSARLYTSTRRRLYVR